MGGAAASVALERLGLDVLQRLIDGGHHVGSLGQSDEMAAAALHRDFRDEAVLFDGQDDLALEVLTEDFREFGEAEFHLAANGGSNFILSGQSTLRSLSSLLAAASMD